MNFWRRHWYSIGGVLFVLLAFLMGLWGCYHLPRIQVILIFSWMAMLVHQVEEYAFPGGMPSITNMAAFREKEAPERYPFNAQQCWICKDYFLLMHRTICAWGAPVPKKRADGRCHRLFFH